MDDRHDPLLLDELTVRRLVVFVSLLAVVAVVVGIAIARPHPRTRVPAIDGGPAPTSIVIVDDRQPRPSDARAAAMSAVEETGSVVSAGPLSRRDLIERLATKRYAPTLIGRVDVLVRGLRVDPDVPGVLCIERALTAEVASVSGDTAVVRVWSVFVVAASRRIPAVELWRTSSLTLKMVKDRWLVDDWSTKSGPSPDPGMGEGGATYDAIAEVVSWTDREPDRRATD